MAITSCTITQLCGSFAIEQVFIKKLGLFTQIRVEFQDINYKIFVLKCIIPPSTKTIYVFTYKQINYNF